MFRHSREGGNPVYFETWIPAFARMTIFSFDFKGLSVPTKPLHFQCRGLVTSVAGMRLK